MSVSSLCRLPVRAAFQQRDQDTVRKGDSTVCAGEACSSLVAACLQRTVRQSLPTRVAVCHTHCPGERHTPLRMDPRHEWYFRVAIVGETPRGTTSPECDGVHSWGQERSSRRSRVALPIAVVAAALHDAALCQRASVSGRRLGDQHRNRRGLSPYQHA